jgi:hypothetical protein
MTSQLRSKREKQIYETNEKNKNTDIGTTIAAGDCKRKRKSELRTFTQT